MSLESDGHGQVSDVFKNGRKSFAFLELIAVWCMVPGEKPVSRILQIAQYWSVCICFIRNRTKTKRS